MTAAQVRAAWAELRAAATRLRTRPAAEVHANLGRWLDAWRSPSGRWRRELEAALPAATGFSPEGVALGLELALAEFSPAALDALIRAELDPPEILDRAPAATAVILAGALPPPSFVSILAPLVLRSAVLVKPSSHDPLTARHLARSLNEVDPDLGACLQVAELRGHEQPALDALLEAECVLVNGSDATVAQIRSRTRPGTHVVGHGHRISLAVFGSAATASDAERLAVDVAAWDQLGCQSPLAVYCFGDADRIASALAGALESAEQRWPRGAIPLEAGAAIRAERGSAAMRAAAGEPVRVHAGAGTTWTVIRESDAGTRPAPLHRFLRVHPVSDPDSLLRALDGVRPHLSSLALAGLGGGEAGLEASLGALEGVRICRAGSLQAPPLAWPRDGRPVLRSLLPGNSVAS